MENPVIQVKNLFKRFRIKDGEIVALHDVSMEIIEGSIVGIIGRSGAGKSTLLRCLNALEKPESGNVFFQDQNIFRVSKEELSKIRQSMGMIFQHFNLLARRTVRQNVALPLEIAGFSESEIDRKAQECLEWVGLENRLSAYPSELSGGQKQRVAIARALACNSRVLLCDEATSALDPETTAEILHLLRDLRERLRITIVLITHEINVIRDICDYVYVMDHGAIVEEGSTERIFASPKHSVTQSFIQSIINSNVPEVIRTLMVDSPGDKASDAVLRLIFTGKSAKEPIIAHFIRNYGTDINIAAGFLDHIGQSTFGTLIITLPNDAQTLLNAKNYLTSQGVQSEILGYIIKS